MNRHDNPPEGLTGRQLRLAALKQFHWRAGIRHQIVDPDIDGLLSAALAYRVFGWPIVGFYDTEALWLDSRLETPLDLSTVAWVDLDMTWPGTRSIGQHVTNVSWHKPAPATWHSVNPSLLRGIRQTRDYKWKYPFGTFQWLWWVLNLSKGEAQLDDPVGRGLAWLPDGGHVSYSTRDGKFAPNLDHWRSTILPGFLLDASDERINPDAAHEEADLAAAHLKERSGVASGWDKEQWRMAAQRGTYGSGWPEIKDDEINRLLEAICEFYGWPLPPTPDKYTTFRGLWNRSDKAGSLQFPDHQLIVSLSATGHEKCRWTSAERGVSHAGGLPSLAEALGTPLAT